MKFICTQENLYRSILKVQGIIGSATPLPILKNILLQTKEGALHLQSTDLEIGISTEVRGKVEEEGELAIDAKIFTSYIALLPQDKITLQSDGKNLTISNESQKTKINGLSAEEFPLIPSINRLAQSTVKARDFKHAITQVLHAAFQDDTRPELHGVYCVIQDSSLTLVSTDSYRLAEKRIALIQKSETEGAYIIPYKTVRELARTIGDDEETVDIYWSDNQSLFSYGQTELVSRLVDGKFPDYKQIIPTSYQLTCELERANFLNALKISGIFASYGTNSVYVEYRASKKELILFCSTPVGEQRSELHGRFEGEHDLKIVFDYRYLLDGVQSIEDDEVVFMISGEATPSVLKPQTDKNDSFIYIVMPIRQ